MALETAARVGVWTAIVAMWVGAVSAQGPAKVAGYASVGEELIAFQVDIDRATLARQASVVLPGFVQEAWASSSGPFLYVAWSNGGSSYIGSGVAPRGDQHGVTAFRVDSTGALHVHGESAPLRSRPIHITGDGSAVIWSLRTTIRAASRFIRLIATERSAQRCRSRVRWTLASTRIRFACCRPTTLSSS